MTTRACDLASLSVACFYKALSLFLSFFSLSQVESSDNRAEENREAQLQLLRDRLRAKEEHRKQVRERKKQLAVEGGDATSLAGTDDGNDTVSVAE